MAGTITASKEKGAARGIVKLKAAITCDASGDATVTEFGSAFGKLVAVGYVPGTFATGVDLTVTDATTGATILSLTNAGTSGRYFRPTAVITDNAGAAVSAAATAVDVNRDIFISGGVKVVAAQGGNLGAGSLFLVVDENGL